MGTDLVLTCGGNTDNDPNNHPNNDPNNDLNNDPNDDPNNDLNNDPDDDPTSNPNDKIDNRPDVALKKKPEKESNFFIHIFELYNNLYLNTQSVKKTEMINSNLTTDKKRNTCHYSPTY